MLFDDLLYVGMVPVVRSGERRALAWGFGLILKEGGSLNFSGFLLLGGCVLDGVSSLVEF